MAGIYPIGQPSPSSPQEDSEELRLFDQAMQEPIRTLVIMGRLQQTLQLTEPHRLQLAKLCAQINIDETAKKIALFVLNETDRFAVIKLAIQADPSGAIGNIDQFNLTKAHLFELTKLCIDTRVDLFLKHIDKFDLDNTQLFEIAKFCIEKKGERLFFSNNIRKFNFDNSQRFEIAKLCINANPRSFIVYISKFDLDQAQLVEIAKNYIYEMDIWIFLPLAAMFCLDENSMIEVLTFAVRRDPQVLEHTLSMFPGPVGISRCIAVLSKMGWIDAQTWENVDPQMHKTLIERSASILRIWSATATEEKLGWLLKEKYLVQLLNLRISYADDLLARSAAAIATHPQFEECSKSLSKRFPSYPILILPLAQLMMQGVNLDSLQLNKRDLKDPKKFIPFGYAMCQLAEDKTLSAEKKTQIIEAMTKGSTDLKKVINNLRYEISVLSGSKKPDEKMIATQQEVKAMSREEMVDRKKEAQERLRNSEGNTHAAQLQTLDTARDLSTILSCNRSDLLQQHDVRDADSLRVQAGEAFKSVVPMPMVDDFMMHYLRTFGKYRQSNALQIYVARLATALRQDGKFHRVLESLGAHVFSVFMGTYTQERYDHTKNPHLEILHKYDPTLLQKWQKNPEAKQLGEYTIHETDDPQDILLCGTEVMGSCQKVDGDPLMNQGLVGYLQNGQTRLLAIKDAGGRIIARRLIRLLWDEKGERPVLFLEKLYSNIVDPTLDKALIEQATQTAKLLNCPLTSLGLPSPEYGDYPSPLQSVGALAPCEYIDGAGGLKEGPYTIHVAQLLPQEEGAIAV